MLGKPVCAFQKDIGIRFDRGVVGVGDIGIFLFPHLVIEGLNAGEPQVPVNVDSGCGPQPEPDVIVLKEVEGPGCGEDQLVMSCVMRAVGEGIEVCLESEGPVLDGERVVEGEKIVIVLAQAHGELVVPASDEDPVVKVEPEGGCGQESDQEKQNERK